MTILSSPVPLQNPRIFSYTSHRSTIFLPRVSSSAKKSFSLKCSRGDLFDTQQQRNSGLGDGAPTARVFVGHSIYKGKAALTVEPKAPEFSPLESGSYKLSREGCIFLQFAPSVGTRQYDWNRKQVFSLSVSEIGMLMNLGPKDSCEFFHDPFKGKSDEGKIRKVLKAEPFPDGGGHFFSLSVQNRLQNIDENIYIPITRAEFTVLNSAFNFVIPYFLGWHAFVDSVKSEIPSGTNRSSSEFEWGR
ncbi:single-stranded DNA-binding protein WHY1, chloroplastic-like [Wolffia australiana]